MKLLFPSVFVLVALTVAVNAQAAEPRVERSDGGNGPLVLILSDKNDDPRLFELNLEVSLNWPAFEARNITVEEVTPPTDDPAGVARSAGISWSSFAVLLVDSDGLVRWVGYSSSILPEVIEQADLIATHRTNG